MEHIHHLMLGTRNAAKIRGVQAAFADLGHVLDAPALAEPVAWTCQVDSGVSEAPLGFPATLEGAQNRAFQAYQRLHAAGKTAPGTVALGLGVESGFIEVALATFTLYNFDICAIFDGEAYYLGISPGFEYPRRLVRDLFLYRRPFQQARQYITTAEGIEQGSGIVGVLAGGLIDRAEMTRLATRLALIRYLQRHHYQRWD
ncbi:MAG: NTPase [Candidatus Tectimicrobiota bacterium]|nr:MAG: NTPase [Candidatus Tectomicrobia bacterium]